MVYTKTELIEAYCKAKGYEEDNKLFFIQEEKVRVQVEIDEQVARFGDAISIMKRIAIRQIQKDLSIELEGIDL